MLGMAIRMATDLNLHRKSMVSGLETEEGRARDLEVRLQSVNVMLTCRSSIAKEHGYSVSYSTDPFPLKWVNHIRYAKTTLSETPAKLHGIYSASHYLRIGLWPPMSSCNRSCRGLLILSIPRLRLYLVCGMIVTVGNHGY
jgi:hypothetical protein